MNTRKLTVFLTLIIVLSMAGMAGAQSVLWDQTAGYEGWSMGFFNNLAGSPPFGSSQYTVNDISVPSGGWNISTVRVYYDGFNPGWAGTVTSAVLSLEPKVGGSPIGDPSTGTTVVVSTVLLGNGFIEVTASGLGLAVAEGEYWIGLTPSTPNSDNIHVSVPAVGADSFTYDPFGFPVPGWAAWVPGFDGAMLIEGDNGAVATQQSSWGETKALFR
ncbi:MAG: hypothetical protein ACI9UK_000379 [Candidatus Krumholzibacteriia bacterium]|jgi:hypothetical protein